MRNPKVVLSSLTSKAQEESYVFERLYRNLYNTEFYLEAYAKLYTPSPDDVQITDRLAAACKLLSIKEKGYFENESC